MSRKPNILWICTDQQRHDTIGRLGNKEINTPNLDALCDNGVAFTRAYCQNPICTPSRASFLSSQYPSTIHVNTNGNEYFPDHIKLFPKYLEESGYYNGLIGKLHIAGAWNGTEKRTDDGYHEFHYTHSKFHGFKNGNEYLFDLTRKGVDLNLINPGLLNPGRDKYYGICLPTCPAEWHHTTWCIDKAIEFIETRKSIPWSLALNIFDPHSPFDAPEIYTAKYRGKVSPSVFCDEDIRTHSGLKKFFFQGDAHKPGTREMEEKASYYGMIDLIDEQIGRLMHCLEQQNLLEDTIIVFTSDHGEMLGDHGLTGKGCRFYEGVVRVPLIFSWKNHMVSGVTCDLPVELMDIAPTLAEMAGVETPEFKGVSLVPALFGKTCREPFHKHIRCEYYNSVNMDTENNKPWDSMPANATMLFDGRYKLSVYHGIEFGQLYDLTADPDEEHNLWEDNSFQALKYGLIKTCFDQTMEIQDHGPRLIGRF